MTSERIVRVEQTGLFGVPDIPLDDIPPTEEEALEAARALEEAETNAAVEEPAAIDGASEVVDDATQPSLFGEELDEFSICWREWKGMPEFQQDDLAPTKSLVVHFASRAHYAAFAKLLNQKLSPRTRSVWYPQAEIGHFADKRYIDARGSR